MPHTLLVFGNPRRRMAMLERLGGDVRIVTGTRPEEFAEAAPEADAALSWFSTRALIEPVLAKATRLRWLHSSSVGLDNVLFPSLIDGPITVTNARGAFSDSLGEFVLAAMLFFAKDLRRMVRSQVESRWDPFDVAMLQNRVLGVVGYGSIGRAAAVRARAFGMKIYVMNRRGAVEDGVADRAFAPPALCEMLAACDYVALALPFTPDTHRVIGRAEIAAMPPHAVLINVGRGQVIDEPALIEALTARRIRGAALDVFEQEPLPPGHPFYSLDNVLLSPHAADHTSDWLEQTMELFLANFERFRAGEPLENVVDKRLGY